MCNVEGGVSAATVDHDNFGFKTLLQLLDSREDSRQRLRLIEHRDDYGNTHPHSLTCFQFNPSTSTRKRQFF
jgi:hypothetical protein